MKIKECFMPIMNALYRIYVFHGGRGGMKSRSIGNLLILMAMKAKLRILCTREIQNTIKDSVHKLLSDIIRENGLEDKFTIYRDSITCINGSEFIFKGVRQNPQEIKSMEGIDICWVEESQSISDESLSILVPTIRKEGSKIIFSLNRLTDDDPVMVKYGNNPDSDTYVKLLTIKDNPFASKTLADEYLRDKRNKAPNFDHVWNGEPENLAEQQVFRGVDKCIEGEYIGKPERTIRYIIGVDLAKHQDYTVIFVADPRVNKIVKKYRWQHLDWDLQIQRVAEIATQWSAKTLIDSTGVGDPVYDYLKKAIHIEPFRFTNENKSQLIQKLIVDIERQNIKFPYDESLIDELHSYRFERTSSGKLTYNARSGKHDDQVIALALCNWQLLNLTSQVSVDTFRQLKPKRRRIARSNQW